MTNTSAGLLEFEELKALIGRYIGGPLGKSELDAVQPRTDRAGIESTLEETREAVEFTRNAGRLPLARMTDVTAPAQKLRIAGAVLEGKEVADLIGFLERAVVIRSELLAQKERCPKLAARAEQIGDFRRVVRHITGRVLPDGSVADDASLALYRIRREIEKQKRSIHQSLDRFLRQYRDDGVLQEDYITIRNDRFVVPVISGQKRRVDGVIHGSSGSGQTLFIEPLETINLNNELVRLNEEELREVHRILREISDELRTQSNELGTSLDVIGRLDLLFAKAEFAIEFDCVIPKFTEARLHLRNARHPLLQDVLRRQKRQVVPLSVTLGDSVRTLLISGPNTGGKTVSMKTLGLLALMAQSGFPVPASEAEFPIFDQVLADIGDQQSIEQSLSTFSAHISYIRDMVQQATAESLVLLDELGRATDPEEGGALGVAILDHFREIGAITLASTHLLALKVYGANTQTVLNASMGFDEATLEPTYVMRVGAPGKSAGIDIATRLGMPSYLIERARAAMSTTEADIARFLSELHQRVDSAAALESELRQRSEDLRRREEKLKDDWARRDEARLRELEGKLAKLSADFERQARETIEAILQGAEQRKAAEQAMRKVSKTKREFQERVTSELGSEPQAGEVRLTVSEGARVLLKGVRSPARVKRVMDDGRLEVEAGFMKMHVTLDDIQEVLPPEKEDSRLPKNVSFRQAGPRFDNFRELNVIGKRSEEAQDEIDRFLDQAAMASVDRVRIVHGHGMGVLKRAVAELLARSPHVEKFYPASYHEGGAGATIVELKD